MFIIIGYVKAYRSGLYYLGPRDGKILVIDRQNTIFREARQIVSRANDCRY